MPAAGAITLVATALGAIVGDRLIAALLALVVSVLGQVVVKLVSPAVDRFAKRLAPPAPEAPPSVRHPPSTPPPLALLSS
jgi:hypothetical protein